MKIFGKKIDGNDPVPGNIKLTGKQSGSENIVLSKVTEEIIRQDLSAIREIFEHINSKLGTIQSLHEYLTDIEELVIKFGNAYENLIVKVEKTLSEARQSNERQEANQRRIIDSNIQIIESQNQIVGALNTFFQSGFPAGNIPPISSLRLIETKSNETIVMKRDESHSNNDPEEGIFSDDDRAENNSLGETSPAGRRQPNEEDPAANFETDNFDERSDAQPSADIAGVTIITPTVNPENATRSILEKIKRSIEKINNIYSQHNLKSVDRNAGDLPGLQLGNLWFIAMPPHPDGTYDPKNLQLDAFKKIKESFSKTDGIIVFAVYDGEIKNKHIGGARTAAADLKFTLAAAGELGEKLGALKIKFDGQNFIRE